MDQGLFFAIFHASLDGRRSVKRISGFGREWPTLEVLPGSGRIVFRSDQETHGVVELFLNFLLRPLARSDKPSQ